jgi:hypothetical protein
VAAAAAAVGAIARGIVVALGSGSGGVAGRNGYEIFFRIWIGDFFWFYVQDARSRVGSLIKIYNTCIFIYKNI